MFKPGTRYTAGAITNGEFHGIYDQLIAIVDGKLEHLTDWWDELAQEYVVEDRLPEGQAYDEALESIKLNIWMTYEGAKQISIFKGVAPNGRGFDVYVNYDCISSEEAE